MTLRDRDDTEAQTLPTVATFPPVYDTFVPLVERAPFGVTIWQKTSDKLEDFTLIYANVQALRESGSELATLLGKTVKEAFPSSLDAPDKYNVPKAWMRALETGESIVINDFPYADTKKACGWYKGYFVPLTSDLVAQIYQDVTESKLSARQIEQQRDELAQSNTELKDLAERLEAANKELERLVTIDPLTELLNRRGLERVMTAAIEEASRKGSSTVLMLADCDDLKEVNDKYGHAFGDILLKEVAIRISGALRKSDFVCRVGGDEFFLVLPDIRPSEAALVAERVRLDVSSSRVVFAAEAVTTTVSIGVAKLPPDVCTIEEMLSLTRVALSSSKTRGKNVVSLSWADQPAPFVKELTTVLRAVTIGKGLRVKIQPILRLVDQKVVGQEFLIRGPAGPLQSPEVLFALGRDHNLLTAIDLRALRTSLEVAKDLDERFRIHLNLFPSTLLEISDAQLLKMLDIGKRICLELSEQQFIGWAGSLLDRILTLKEAGIKIAIDDVGGGPGALDSVILLEPDVLKIDKKIIDDISHDDRKVRLLQRIIRLAHVVEAQVIAEGVETKEDLAVLKELGLEFAQGFLWSRPVDISELRDDYAVTSF